jgi:hypothetical protein
VHRRGALSAMIMMMVQAATAANPAVGLQRFFLGSGQNAFINFYFYFLFFLFL